MSGKAERFGFRARHSRGQRRAILTRTAALLSAWGLILAGPVGVAYAGTAPGTEPDSAAPQLYQRDCGWCHGPDGRGTNRGPTLVGVGAASADFNLRTGRMPIESADEPPRRGDPAYDRDEIAEITRYIAGLGDGPQIPEVSPQRGEVALGAELYRDHCAACHSVTGSGGALTGGNVAPTLVGSHPVEVAQAMIIGGEGTFTGSMPVFDADVFDEHEMNSVLAYVEYLQQPDNRGGAPLGRTGPIGEGLVAVGVAIPALVLFMRWAGSRQ